mmetsp:Transcript_40214/g.99671  ORF Transcript_40214/g.99671 Transcript_40214/m.99671 type:complete len:92 (-) Transcript_40214:21-296(-)
MQGHQTNGLPESRIVRCTGYMIQIYWLDGAPKAIKKCSLLGVICPSRTIFVEIRASPDECTLRKEHSESFLRRDKHVLSSLVDGSPIAESI